MLSNPDGTVQHQLGNFVELDILFDADSQLGSTWEYVGLLDERFRWAIPALLLMRPVGRWT